MSKGVQCGECFQMVDILPDGLGSLHKCNGKDRRVRVELKDQPFYKELKLSAPTPAQEVGDE